MKSRKLDEIISNLEDVTTTVEEARELQQTDPETLDEAEHTLEDATDTLEEMEEQEEEGEGSAPR